MSQNSEAAKALNFAEVKLWEKEWGFLLLRKLLPG